MTSVRVTASSVKCIGRRLLRLRAAKVRRSVAMVVERNLLNDEPEQIGDGWGNAEVGGSIQIDQCKVILLVSDRRNTSSLRISGFRILSKIWRTESVESKSKQKHTYGRG